jgi:uncharacterized membrane protein
MLRTRESASSCGMVTRAKPKAKQAPEEISLVAHILRHGRAQIRFLISLCVGVAVALFAPIEDVIPRLLAGWNAGGWVYLTLIGIKMARAEAEGIKREADIERESRIAVLFIVTFGSIFALLALFVQLMALKSEHGYDRNISIAVSVLTIILSWLLIHTVFASFTGKAKAAAVVPAAVSTSPTTRRPTISIFSISPSWSASRRRPPMSP